MRMSESINELAKALAIFQGEVNDPRKEASNPFFKSKYVTLDSLIDAVRPVLSKNGLSFIQCPSGDGANISVTTLLMHNSGQFIESDPFIMKAAKADPQSAGSAVTYGRRYSLQAVLGVAWCDADDDGNSCSLISKDQQKKLCADAKKKYGEDAKRKTLDIIGLFGYKKTEEIAMRDYQKILDMVNE